MNPERTEGLIAKLAANLEPVKPIAPISRTFALVLGVVALVGVLVFAGYGPKPDLLRDFAGNATYASVLVGLGLAGLGGCLATLASVIPGREALVRLGGGLAAAGLVLGVGVAAWMTPWGEARLEDPLAHLACVLRGAVFAGLPAAAVLGLAARGWAGRPDLTVGLGLLGTGAAGALLVHLSCPAVAPLHVLCTHVSTPILIAVLGTAVLAPLMRHLAR